MYVYMCRKEKRTIFFSIKYDDSASIVSNIYFEILCPYVQIHTYTILFKEFSKIRI